MTVMPPTGRSFGQQSRRGFLGMIGIGAAASLAACAPTNSNGGSTPSGAEVTSAEIDGDLNLFSWAQYVPDEVIAGFEKEYGVKVNITNFSTVDEMMTKLATNQPYDLTFAPSERIKLMAEGGLIQRLDHDLLENYGEVLPQFVVPPYNPGDDAANEFIAPFVGTPYATGSVGLAWRNDIITGMTGSLNDLWTQADAASGHLYLWDDMTLTLSLVLRAIGHAPQDAGQAELDEALAAIKELRPNLGGWSGISEEMITSGQAWLTPIYAANLFMALQSLDNAEQWSFQNNTESALFNADNLVIPATAEHTGTAVKFIDWVLAPENMEQVVNWIAYPIPTTTGMATYNELIADVPWIGIDEAIFADSEQWVAPVSDEALPLWRQTWSQAKAG
ncbi:spermidine/putrescine ABC transporter substrate-binding protein [Leucobacter soli]|uniref:Spermidine/putrescine-binding periplasmic protein n=1 Tax=Leucobacter soli TaxID=2812850 RepID=A0A916NH97_9MICO|nr:spermidine/putrescine ABC transporter substrate-binding protein [Leucobacter soli]CAG7608305.1 Spermidine/putrescine-binding periplasmic protein [Leucobacter soli]